MSFSPGRTDVPSTLRPTGRSGQTSAPWTRASPWPSSRKQLGHSNIRVTRGYGHVSSMLARLAADGARPAGPPSLPAGTSTAIEVERMVNGTGLPVLACRQVNGGCEPAGERVTLRMDGTQMAGISHDGALLRTLPASSGRPTGTGYAEPDGQPTCQHDSPDQSSCNAAYPSVARSWSPPSASMSA